MLATYDLIEFSEKLKQIRNNLGFTIDHVSSATGISTSTIKAMEKGKNIPRFDTLQILSGFYKMDLINLLSEYKYSSNILSLYHILNKYMASGDHHLIKVVINEITLLLENDELKPIDNRNLLQLKNYFKALEIATQCNPKSLDLNEKTIQNMIDVLKISNPNFSLEHFDKFNYFSVEYNILFSISSLLGLNRDCENSNQIFLHILKYYSSLDLYDFYTQFYCTKIYYMIAYNYHRMDQHKLALEYAEMGIHFCNDNDTFQHLPLLLARKSIALFYLKDTEWEIYRDQTLALLEIQNKHNQLDNFKEVFNKLQFSSL